MPLPRGVDMRTPDPDNVDRAQLHQWNVTLERRLPLDLGVDVAYVGTQTNGGYADVNLNYAEPGTGNAGRQFFAQAGNATILDWGGWTTQQVPLAADGGQPAVQERAAAQGRLHLEQGHERDRRGRVGGRDVEHPEPVRPQLRARRV